MKTDGTLDRILEDIENKKVVSTKKKEAIKDLKTRDPTSLKDVSDEILERINDTDGFLDEIYKLFYGPLSRGQDFSEASKEALVRSIELKIESTKILADLARSLAKKDAGNQSSQNVGVFIGTSPGEKFGINLNNINEEL